MVLVRIQGDKPSLAQSLGTEVGPAASGALPNDIHQSQGMTEHSQDTQHTDPTESELVQEPLFQKCNTRSKI